MKKTLLSALFAFVCSAVAMAASPSPLMKLPLVDSIKIGDFDIEETGVSRHFTLPKMQPRPGYIPVLRCRMATYKDGFGGCCFAAKLAVSGTELEAQTAAGDIRMLGKHARFEMKSSFAGRQFDYWAANDAKIDKPYGPSCDAVDNDSIGGDASVYLLDLSDVLSSNDSNTLTFTNIRPKRRPVLPLTLMVRDCEVGYISKDIIPPRPSTQIAYEPMQLKRSRNNITIEVGKAGGFAITSGENRLIVESRLSMDFNTPNTVLASDTRKPKVNVTVKNHDYGPYGVKTVVKFPNNIELTRTLKVGHDGLVHWKEDWKNCGKNIIGVPFHHRLSINIKDPRMWLSGQPEASFIPTAGSHPTIVFEERIGKKRGFGFTMESDMPRLLNALKNIGDTAEVYTATLALAPGMKQSFQYSLDPIDKGGYFTFMNRLRERWKLNTITAERPLFLGLVPKALPQNEEKAIAELRKTFGHLGKIAITIKPWRSADRLIMLDNTYPKLPNGEKRYKGKKTPDLDIEAYLTYDHRKRLDAYQAKWIKIIKKALPDALVIQMTHPSMEAVYLPMEEHWDYADCAIRDKNGNIYHLPHYDESHLKKSSGTDGWIMGYYVPYGGSKYYEKLLNDIQRGLDIGFDGLYIDEFSFVFERAGYNRYTYDRWDGFSADLDKKGNVQYLKSDNAYTSASFQHAAVELVRRQNKYFLGNLMTPLRSLNNAPNLRFWEAAFRVGWSHIDKVPTLLGHTNGDLAKTFEGVRHAIGSSCLYSPFAKSAKYFDDPENFVVKQYPFTTVKLMENGIVGKERIMVTESGEYEWPGTPDGSTAKLFIYNKSGMQVNKGRFAKVENGKIKLRVPKGGLVIAELQTK